VPAAPGRRQAASRRAGRTLVPPPRPCHKTGMADPEFHDLFPKIRDDATPYRKLTSDFVAAATFDGERMLKVDPAGLTELARQAMIDCQHLLRPGHLAQLRRILDDPEASQNDKFVAYEFLKNANIAAGKILPMCQDTGTAIVMGKKGQRVWTGANDAAALAAGIRRTYTETNLRYSQVAPLSMFEEKNTGDNLPAQIEIYAEEGDEYRFLFVAKGGGSANKTFLYQATPAVLNHAALLKFVDEKIRTLGTAACPPYHLAIVIGGTSAELNLKTVKLASTRYLDGLPTRGNPWGQAFRDTGFEEEVLGLTRKLGLGAQFGGKYFCHDVRVVRLPRHGASVPIGIGVSCSADRQILGKITADGIFLEQLEENPAQHLPEVDPAALAGEVVKIDLRAPMTEIRRTLSRHPIKTRLSLSGPLIVARDLAHARIKERLDRGEGLPQYMKDHAIYYAGPAKTPKGYASGAFGPTTAGRMDSYVDQFMAAGGSLVTLAKGNRGAEVREACRKHGGFYLGSIGGVAANLAEKSIKKVEQVEFAELGMEAVWRIEVEDFPAFIVIDDKGNDFFAAAP
jgi:fumarate hydratase class I